VATIRPISSPRVARDPTPGRDRVLEALAVDLERHEEAVWIECLHAAAGLRGNPLGATVARTPVVMTALGTIDHPVFNRVITLGIGSPAVASQVAAVTRFYDDAGERFARIEVSPAAQPTHLTSWLAAAGFVMDEEPILRMWRAGDDDSPLPTHDEVRLLGPGDRAEVGALGVRAWGAWHTQARQWFGATVGHDGFRHYGVFDGSKLVAVGAMCIHEGSAWAGFDATHPRYRTRGLRMALVTARMDDAYRLGCRHFHGEVVGTLHPGLRRVAYPLYVKVSYTRDSRRH